MADSTTMMKVIKKLPRIDGLDVEGVEMVDVASDYVRWYPGDSRSRVVFVHERYGTVRTPGRWLKICALRHVLNQPLSEGLAGRLPLIPHMGGHHDEGLPGANALRPFVLRETKNLG